MTTLVVAFSDLEKLAIDGDKRIYLFEGSDFVDFHIVHDSIITKSRLSKENIEDPRVFFSQRMFMGAMTLGVNVPMPKPDMFEKSSLDVALVKLEDVQDEETKNTDIQQEGVE